MPRIITLVSLVCLQLSAVGWDRQMAFDYLEKPDKENAPNGNPPSPGWLAASSAKSSRGVEPGDTRRERLVVTEAEEIPLRNLLRSNKKDGGWIWFSYLERERRSLSTIVWPGLRSVLVPGTRPMSSKERWAARKTDGGFTSASLGPWSKQEKAAADRFEPLPMPALGQRGGAPSGCRNRRAAPAPKRDGLAQAISRSPVPAVRD